MNCAIILKMNTKPSQSALSRPLWKRLPASDQVYQLIPCNRRGEWPHHGGDVCGIVVLVVDGTFRTIPTIGIPQDRSFFVPAGTISLTAMAAHEHPFFDKFHWSLIT